MRMLLVAAGGNYVSALSYHLKPIGFEVEHIADPLRAIDLLEQIDPQAILIHAGDFPRHWKPIVKLARDRKTREELVCLLAAPPDFPLEDAIKAAYLGVNGILGEDLADKGELYRLQDIVRRHQTVGDKRNFVRMVPQATDELGFAFTHPMRLAYITGRVREISIQGSNFQPSRPSAVIDLSVGSVIKHCSLKVEDTILAVDCRITRNREEIGFQFLSFEEGGQQTLQKYIEARSARALKNAAAR